jgi:hypothetical protein
MHEPMHAKRMFASSTNQTGCVEYLSKKKCFSFDSDLQTKKDSS